MKLLIVTQKVDRNDPVLGFFHRWIVEFAKHIDFITVVCLQSGVYDLPVNVEVLSLGKEYKASRPRYIAYFYRYILRERKNYDAVFVHMNQEYLLLAGWLWRLWPKKVTMWRNHHAGSLLTDVAAFFCHKVFCTSKYSYTAKYKKTRLMPVGIDTDVFKPVQNIRRIDNSILFLGRISPSKKPDMLIEALGILNQRGTKFTVSIYGDSLPEDAGYHCFLKERVRQIDLENVITFYPGLPNDETPDVYSQHRIFTNLSSSGMYDKTIFEAMACGCLSLSSNRNLEGQVDPGLLFEEGNIESLAVKLQDLIDMDPAKQADVVNHLQSLVNNSHSLSKLALSLSDAIQSIE